MRAVGLRELKNRPSEYVRQVRKGEGVLVTDRGEVVASLRRVPNANLLTSASSTTRADTPARAYGIGAHFQRGV